MSLGATTTLNNVTVSGNSAGTNGGGLFSQGGMTTLTDVTVSGNSAAADGGGLSNRGGTTTLTNVTVSGNAASVSGGGLYASGGTTKLTNVTVSGNSASVSGGGLFSEVGATTLTNTIVAGQTAGGDISSAVLGSFNLIGTGGSGGLLNGVAGNIVGVADPGLAPLGAYGGPTQTMALLPGSAAVSAGTKGVAIPTTDQRGFSRQGAADIGAFEVGGETVNTTEGSVLSSPGQLTLPQAINLANVLPGARRFFLTTRFSRRRRRSRWTAHRSS